MRVVHRLVRRSHLPRSPPLRALRRNHRLLNSKEDPTKLSHNERTKADWPLTRGALFFAWERSGRRYFADEQICIDDVAAMRWPNGPVCPKCESGEMRQRWLKAQKRWQRRDCGKHYSVKVNTIIEDSALNLAKWLTAM